MTTRCYTCNKEIVDYKEGFAILRSEISFINDRHGVESTNAVVQIICNDCGRAVISHPTRVPNLKEYK